MNKHIKHLRGASGGFTLIELMIALVVTGLLIGVLMNFMLGSLVTSTVEAARASLLGDAQTTLDIVDNDVQLSASADQNNRWQDANAPDPGNELSWESDNDTLVLATAAQDSSGNIIFSDPLKYITEKNNLIYFVQDGTLYKRVLAASVSNNGAVTTCPAAKATATCPPDKVMAAHVSSFSVEYFDAANQQVPPSSARSIQITLGLADTQYGHHITVSYTTRMVFRND